MLGESIGDSCLEPFSVRFSVQMIRLVCIIALEMTRTFCGLPRGLCGHTRSPPAKKIPAEFREAPSSNVKTLQLLESDKLCSLAGSFRSFQGKQFNLLVLPHHTQVEMKLPGLVKVSLRHGL